MALSEVSPRLIAAAQRGERESIEDLISVVSPDLYRILFSMLRDHDSTDEVLQETLIRLFRYIGSLKEIERFPAWLMRIAVNQAQTFRAKRSRTWHYEMDEAIETNESATVIGATAPENPRNKMMRDQVREEITAAMDALPDRQRMATVLFEVEGYSIREVAEILKCSEGAVKFNIHEGRKKLKRRLFHLVRGTRWGRKRAGDEELESAAEEESQRDGSAPDPAAEKGARGG